MRRKNEDEMQHVIETLPASGRTKTPVATVAHILPWATVGGVEHATLRIAQAVGDAGFESVAFCFGEPPLVRDMFERAGFETCGYEPTLPSYRHPVNHLRASLRLAGELRRRKVDLVHCSDLLGSFYGATAARLARLPVLCHIRVREDALSRRDQSFLRLVNHFAFVSRDTWKRFAYPVPAHRGTIIYDGIDLGAASDHGEARRRVCEEFGIPQTAKIVGMVARVAPQKDYPTLIKAARRVVATSDEDVRFLVVGDNSTTAQYREHYTRVKEMLADHELGSRFVFTGFREDARRFLGAMDVFVLSTHAEGLPLVILEAMAEARPVVATNVDGIPEIVLHEQTGLLHEHEDDAGLANHIIALLRDEDRARRLGAAARTHVERDFSREQFAASMSNLYGEMLSRRTPVTASGRAAIINPEVENG